MELRVENCVRIMCVFLCVCLYVCVCVCVCARLLFHILEMHGRHVGLGMLIVIHVYILNSSEALFPHECNLSGFGKEEILKFFHVPYC